MSELDMKILEVQEKLLRLMNEEAKKQYLAFGEGMLAHKQMAEKGKEE